MKYFITYNGQTIGPMTIEQLMSYPVTPDTPVCTEDNQVWQPLYAYPELMETINRYTACRNDVEVNTTGKDKVLCGILALLLGGFGAHYFYLGKIGGAIICILLCLVTCGAWSVVTFIQGILILTMTQAQFEQKFVLTPSTFPIY